MGRIAQLAGVVALTALSASISQVSHAADDLSRILSRILSMILSLHSDFLGGPQSGLGNAGNKGSEQKPEQSAVAEIYSDLRPQLRQCLE